MASKPVKPPRPQRVSPALVAAPLPTEEVTMDTTATATEATFANVDAKTMITDATERAKNAFAKGQQGLVEMGAFSKGNVEALVESSKIAAKGIEAMSKDAAAYVRASFEEAQSQAKSLASAGSPTEFVRLQSEFARAAFDRMVAETSKNTEAMLKLAGEVAQPISNRVALAVDRFKVAA